jgi:UTP--glucose-1-phosphate uridylyltransferase
MAAGQRVTMAVFPVAGLATRFLPATKAIPKLLLPLVDKPTIQYGVEEAIDSGIEEIVMVTGGVNDMIREHFAPNPALEEMLERRGKDDLLATVRGVDELARRVSIAYVEQQEPLGLGHAVWTARRLVAGRPAACLLPDDVIVGPKPCLAQLIEVHEERGGTVLAAYRVPKEQVGRYGIIASKHSEGRLHEVADVIEKPEPGQAPSDLAILGRYVLAPEVFEALDDQRPGAGGEIQLTDGIKATIPSGKVWALEFEGEYLDTGEIAGYIRANVAMGLRDPRLRARLEPQLRALLEA